MAARWRVVMGIPGSRELLNNNRNGDYFHANPSQVRGLCTPIWTAPSPLCRPAPEPDSSESMCENTPTGIITLSHSTRPLVAFLNGKDDEGLAPPVHVLVLSQLPMIMVSQSSVHDGYGVLGPTDFAVKARNGCQRQPQYRENET